MKKNLNARKAQPLKLNRETLFSLEKNGGWIAGGSQAELEVPSVKFCTDSGCTTSGG
jgi:hypothetical protein